VVLFCVPDTTCTYCSSSYMKSLGVKSSTPQLFQRDIGFCISAYIKSPVSCQTIISKLPYPSPTNTRIQLQPTPSMAEGHTACLELFTPHTALKSIRLMSGHSRYGEDHATCLVDGPDFRRRGTCSMPIRWKEEIDD
jgi:hypothetical protein